jgi:hypothetical protein
VAIPSLPSILQGDDALSNLCQKEINSISKEIPIDFWIFILAGLGMAILYISNINYEIFGVPVIHIAWINIPFTRFIFAKGDRENKEKTLLNISLAVVALISTFYLFNFYRGFFFSKIPTEYYILLFSFTMVLFILKNLSTLLVLQLLRLFRIFYYKFLIFFNAVFALAYMSCYCMYVYWLFMSIKNVPALLINISGSVLVISGFLFSDVRTFKYIAEYRNG